MYKATIDQQRNFIGWIREKYPEVWKVWEKN